MLRVLHIAILTFMLALGSSYACAQTAIPENISQAQKSALPIPITALPLKPAAKDNGLFLPKTPTAEGVHSLLGQFGLLVLFAGGPALCAINILLGLIWVYFYGRSLVYHKWPRWVVILLCPFLTSFSFIVLWLVYTYFSCSSRDCGASAGFALVLGVLPMAAFAAILSLIIHGVMIGRMQLKRQKPSKS
jgi:hypothetical protein